MSQRFVASFEDERDILSAVAAYRGRGLTIEDAFTPYAVHGLDEAAGVPRSRLGWVCALLGLSAAGLAMFFQIWVSAVDWPLNIGGKPLSSIPAFVPVTFEVGVLAAGIGSLIAFLIVSRLYPGKRTAPVLSGSTDDRFVLVVSSGQQRLAEEEVLSIARQYRAVEARVERTPPKRPGRAIDVGEGTIRWGRVNVVLGVVLALVVLANLSIGSRAERRGVEFLPEMVVPVAAESYASHPSLPDQRTLQAPPAGTIARGSSPFRLAPGEEGSVQAANILDNPLEEGLEGELARGERIYGIYCRLCHGATGRGDGPVAQRGFPMPPAWLASRARDLADGQLFHLITVGQGNMPGHAGQIDSLDRWRAVLWVRRLQEAAPAPDAGVAPAEGAPSESTEPEVVRRVETVGDAAREGQ